MQSAPRPSPDPRSSCCRRAVVAFLPPCALTGSSSPPLSALADSRRTRPCRGPCCHRLATELFHCARTPLGVPTARLLLDCCCSIAGDLPSAITLRAYSTRAQLLHLLRLLRASPGNTTPPDERPSCLPTSRSRVACQTARHVRQCGLCGVVAHAPHRPSAAIIATADAPGVCAGARGHLDAPRPLSQIERASTKRSATSMIIGIKADRMRADPSRRWERRHASGRCTPQTRRIRADGCWVARGKKNKPGPPVVGVDFGLMFLGPLCPCWGTRHIGPMCAP